MKYASKSLVALYLCSGVAIASTASAEGMALGSKQLTPQEQQTYSTLDSNGDGYISKSEAQANPSLASKFDIVDSDQDKQLDEGEFARFEMIESDDAPERQ